jgi:hypothetical protein
MDAAQRGRRDGAGAGEVTDLPEDDVGSSLQLYYSPIEGTRDVSSAMSDSNYDSDFYAWANEQAALLRAGRLGQADIEHIAQEIESMGRRRSASS